MGDGVEICGGSDIEDPEPFSPVTLEAGVIALTIEKESIDPLKAKTIPVNGEAIVVVNGLVLDADSAFLPLLHFLL